MNQPFAPHDHLQFDSLTAQVEDYEPLPEVVPGPAEATSGLSAQDPTDSIDEEILAALVSP